MLNSPNAQVHEYVLDLVLAEHVVLPRGPRHVVLGQAVNSDLDSFSQHVRAGYQQHDGGCDALEES